MTANAVLSDRIVVLMTAFSGGFLCIEATTARGFRRNVCRKITSVDRPHVKPNCEASNCRLNLSSALMSRRQEAEDEEDEEEEDEEEAEEEEEEAEGDNIDSEEEEDDEDIKEMWPLISSLLSLLLLSVLSDHSDEGETSVLISVIWDRLLDELVLDCFDAAIMVEEEDCAVVADDKGESDDADDDDDDDDAAAAILLLFFSFIRSSAFNTSV